MAATGQERKFGTSDEQPFEWLLYTDTRRATYANKSSFADHET